MRLVFQWHESTLPTFHLNQDTLHDFIQHWLESAVRAASCLPAWAAVSFNKLIWFLICCILDFPTYDPFWFSPTYSLELPWCFLKCLPSSFKNTIIRRAVRCPGRSTGFGIPKSRILFWLLGLLQIQVSPPPESLFPQKSNDDKQISHPYHRVALRLKQDSPCQQGLQ